MRYGIGIWDDESQYYDMPFKVHTNPVPINYISSDCIRINWDNIILLTII